MFVRISSNMNKVLFVSLSLTYNLCWGQELRSPMFSSASHSQELKPEMEEDYVDVYRHVEGPTYDHYVRKINLMHDLSPEQQDLEEQQEIKKSKENFLKTTLTIHDNIELSGVPIYTVTPFELKTNAEMFKFKDVFVGACAIGCEKYIYIPIDFIRASGPVISLAVKDLKNGIARVVHKNKNYYFKFNMKYSKSYQWRKFKKSENVKVSLERDTKYLDFVSEIKKCIHLKSLECLNSLLQSPSNATLEELKKEAGKRAVYSDKILCDQFISLMEKSEGQIGIDDVPADLIKKTKNIDIVWNKINESLGFSSVGVSRELVVENFGEVFNYTIRKNFEKPSTCAELSMDYVLNLTTKDLKWKIFNYGFSGFSY